jgi:DNA-binding LacI/PurR family transcriptional regulator
MPDESGAARAACAALLRQPDPPTAFACVSDTIALGAWTELTARGLVPGRDTGVTGFDDTAAAEVVGLTSVAQPLTAVADACLDALLTAPRTPPPPGRTAKAARRRVLLEPRLVVRDSS